MKIASKVDDNVILVSFEGDLTFECINDVKETIDGFLHSSPDASLFLDLEKVSTLDSAGIGLLVTIYRKVVFSRKTSFGLIKPSEHLIKMLESAGFTRLVKIYASEKEALNAVKASS